MANKPVALEAVNDRGFTVRVISTYFLFDMSDPQIWKSPDLSAGDILACLATV